MRLLASIALLASLLSAACGKVSGPAAPGTAKIGIVTGTVSQGEDEVRAAEALKKEYPGRVIHVTYPDNFMQEQDTTISQITALASDPEVKVILLGQAVPGSSPAIRRIRETRKDILFGLVEPHEDPIMVNQTADFAILPDQEARARAIVSKMKELGATTLVHYSFPRHMSMELIARRKKLMEEECAKAGVEFVFVSAPDPMSEGGLPATQQFILEDVPREVKRYGKDVAFFSTNCGMQDPLIKAVLQTGAMYAEPCCPSPTHGFPTALGISVPADKAGDFAFINAENARMIRSHGLAGRFVTWPVPANYAAIRATAALLLDATEGKADYRDPATVKRYLEKAAGAPVFLRKYDEESGNFWLMLVDQIVY